MIQKQYKYFDGNTELLGYLCYDEAATKPLPAVLICPDWSGRNEFADTKAKKMSENHFVGFTVDVYGNGQLGKTKEEKSALIQPLMNDRALLRKRLLAAYKAVSSLSEVDQSKIAVMGFCFGGLCALDLARSGALLKGAISFHGSLSPPDKLPNEKINAKILALHGYDDPMVPPEQVNAFAEEMTKANADWQIHMYGHTLHAFTNPQANDVDFGTVYNEVANRRSMQSLSSFLSEIFDIS